MAADIEIRERHVDARGMRAIIYRPAIAVISDTRDEVVLKARRAAAPSGALTKPMMCGRLRERPGAEDDMNPPCAHAQST